jgi:hypothetical protein
MISCVVVSSGSAGQEVSLRFCCVNDNYDKHKTKGLPINIPDFLTKLVYELYLNVLSMSTFLLQQYFPPRYTNCLYNFLLLRKLCTEENHNSYSSTNNISAIK